MKRLLLAATAAVSIVSGQQAHAGDLECGSDRIHSEVTELWNENMERWQPRIVDIYADAVSTAPGKPDGGKVLLNCTARATMTRGADQPIHYTVQEQRGKWFVHVHPAPAPSQLNQ